MLSFNYTLTTYKTFLEQLAQFFGASFTNHMLYIPTNWGTGFFKVIDLGNGIEVLAYDINLKEDLLLNRKKDENQHYTLILDEVEKTGGITVTIEKEQMDAHTDRMNALYLTSFLFDIESMVRKNFPIRGLRVLLNLSWMQKYLQLSDKEEVLERYINLKTTGIWYKSVDAESREALHEILKQEHAPLLFYQNKVLGIVERFFNWLYDETKVLGEKTGISRFDIESAQKVENILTHDDTVIPPTITELAKEVAMSESKLKKVFKTVYGIPPYEYFQKHRMQKARVMLLSGDYSIKDVGYTLGYSNLSNFTLAFKKAFDKLPSELIRKTPHP